MMITPKQLSEGIEFRSSPFGLLKLQNWHDDGPWLFKPHPDGDGWVSLRKALEQDIQFVEKHLEPTP